MHVAAAGYHTRAFSPWGSIIKMDHLDTVISRKEPRDSKTMNSKHWLVYDFGQTLIVEWK